ncbi:MAG: endonuclease/exonuclease/phosphatase family protein [Armatimonadetes bacterium]|nr:endonuclease/exonuclease/phosphatase family protein [Armatimonadota bacterium]
MDCRLAVMTYNIRYGLADDGTDSWPFRKDALIQVIRNNAPDILGVQEALLFQINEIARALPGYCWYGVGREDGGAKGEHCPIFSRYPMSNTRTIWISDDPDAPGSLGPGADLPRIITVATVDCQGTKITLANTHLDHQSERAREIGAKMLADCQPDIAMGDFNCLRAHSPVQQLVATGFDCVNPAGQGQGTFNGFDPLGNGGEIDFIFHNHGFVATSAKIDRTLRPDGRTPSDHYPVVAELCFTG